MDPLAHRHWCSSHVAAEGETTRNLAEHAARRANRCSGRPDFGYRSESASVRRRRIWYFQRGTLLQTAWVSTAVLRSAWRLLVPDLFTLKRRGQIRASGEAKCALVVGAETLTRIIDWNDRGTCVLFADARARWFCSIERTRES